MTVEGHQCEGSTAATAVGVTAEFSRKGRPYASLPLPANGAAYAFRMTFVLPANIQTPTGTADVLPGDRVSFTTSGGTCRSDPVRVR